MSNELCHTVIHGRYAKTQPNTSCRFVRLRRVYLKHNATRQLGSVMLDACSMPMLFKRDSQPFVKCNQAFRFVRV